MGTQSIMFQGTASDSGKSWVAAGLCRILKNRGLKVAPFKSQNMALNSYITADGKEMGRAQVFQAEAAGVAPDVRMNPLLLKPSTDKESQVVFMGKVLTDMTAVEYQNHKMALKDRVLATYRSLAAENDVMVLEGAGSPAEINLDTKGLVNMGMAEMAHAPVILVADIDKGGMYASIYGTIKLLPEEDQKRLKGIIVNKFRGDASLLKPGNDMIEELTGVPVIGVIPMTDVDLDEEDSVALERKSRVMDTTKDLDVAVMALQKLSNFTDFHSLEIQPDVSVRYVVKPEDLGNPDLLILPGSKNTNEDMAYLREHGFVSEIQALHERKTQIVGICGGYQMLGSKLHDPNHVESDITDQDGLQLLDIQTTFTGEKTTTQAIAQHAGTDLHGYEIHMGETSLGVNASPFSTIIENNGQPEDRLDGAVNADGSVWGTYLHGIFDNTAWTRQLLDQLRVAKGLQPLHAKNETMAEYKEAQYEKLAKIVEENVDMAKIDDILAASDVDYRK
ncbi:cobyric acid synthase [Secundilactobacillus paracollinoides]|uniref:Cobyric acid synthase n=1 Tax=Secundilactobacillus paracollinoides TaxID=240427 RepID=A0A1B2IYH7_9LACO|nr:cobyric acid synthase [Secundilactobacillus paracollinoides]ANZ61172.1 cobyric acid synthase CobQ [Secundilactobacillus paracollinoides]ANZ67093.1 cobyric acid synthase CobQ [Secundilactobacillus paracollinoides]